MNTLQSIQLFTCLNAIVLGISHLIRPNIWLEFFAYLHSKGNIGNIFNALLSLGTGSLILSFHFIWDGSMIIVTIYGLALLLKGMIYLSFPSIGLKSIEKLGLKTQNYKWAGLLMCTLGLAIFIELVLNGAFSH